MSQTLQPVRGTKDLVPDDYKFHRTIIEAARQVSGYYGFDEMSTPIVESTDVFKRTLGETSDVVGKEMYEFSDKGGDSICLRPEFTAGVVRAFINSGLTQKLPQRWFTTGPLFRYERPQKGRQRQFHQINFEIIGDDSPLADAELMTMAHQLLMELELSEYVTLEINTLGDSQSRLAYKEALVQYLEPRQAELSEHSQARLTKNPLRILDSKDAQDQEIIKNAPKMQDYLTESAQQFYAQVKHYLTLADIPFVENPTLVRGLDYDCHTAFEFTTKALGAQNAVLAGGRYDGLIERMGGGAIPAVGFAGGIERLALLLKENGETIPDKLFTVVIPMDTSLEDEAFLIAQQLRLNNVTVELSFSGAVKKRLKKASDRHAEFVVFVGENEWKNKQVRVKDLATSEEEVVDVDDLAEFIDFGGVTLDGLLIGDDDE